MSVPRSESAGGPGWQMLTEAPRAHVTARDVVFQNSEHAWESSEYRKVQATWWLQSQKLQTVLNKHMQKKHRNL